MHVNVTFHNSDGSLHSLCIEGSLWIGGRNCVVSECVTSGRIWNETVLESVSLCTGAPVVLGVRVEERCGSGPTVWGLACVWVLYPGREEEPKIDQFDDEDVRDDCIES